MYDKQNTRCKNITNGCHKFCDIKDSCIGYTDVTEK